MKRILMILTSHRLDCFRLAMDLLKATGSLQKFDRVVLMLNGVTGRHLAYVRHLMATNPSVPWDTIAGPRGKGERVASLQNETVKRYPDSLYFKMDEDLFVADGWVEKLAGVYAQHRRDPNLALITPVIPNNAAGFYFLVNAFPELNAEYRARFAQPLTTDYNGPIWINPYIAEWIIRKFLDMREANARLASLGAAPVRFAYRFSINCLVYDYKHWTELGGIPNDEEPAWTQWVADHGKFNVLATDTLLQHYCFFVQQEWLDRSSVLEDLRRANLPDTLRLADYGLARAARIARQIPSILRRRLGCGG